MLNMSIYIIYLTLFVSFILTKSYLLNNQWTTINNILINKDKYNPNQLKQINNIIYKMNNII